jgi:hypothetical protein
MTDTNRLTIKVSGLAHKLTLEFLETTTIDQMKQEIELRTSLPAAYQRLICRGKKLDDNKATLQSLDIRNRTSIMLLHNEFYAADKQALDEIMELSRELDQICASTNMNKEMIREQVTVICCKLDGLDTHGSEPLRAMRKQVLEKAELVDPTMKK